MYPLSSSMRSPKILALKGKLLTIFYSAREVRKKVIHYLVLPLFLYMLCMLYHSDLCNKQENVKEEKLL